MQPSIVYCSSCGKVNQPQASYCFQCGAAMQIGALLARQATGRIPPGQVLNQRYRIVKLAGKGGMGAVYQAEDLKFGARLVAVKEMSQSNLSPQEIIEATERFEQEAQLLAGLKHPNLPSIYDYFSESGNCYLVMDFIEGKTLDEYLTNKRILAPTEVLEIGIQLSKTLGYLHNRPSQIIFRDLKPLNVMITPEENIYLIDFGIARLFKVGKTKDTISYVSAGYAAPEQSGTLIVLPRVFINMNYAFEESIFLNFLYYLGVPLFGCLIGGIITGHKVLSRRMGFLTGAIVGLLFVALSVYSFDAYGKFNIIALYYAIIYNRASNIYLIIFPGVGSVIGFIGACLAMIKKKS